MAKCLGALGADISERPEGLIIRGTGKLSGGTADGCGDHRVIMALAIAATVADGPVIIKGAEAVAKSYPGFFRDFRRLGGLAEQI
jgi:5-enolpyruvylshikimate-3-phosphate synthase